MSDDQPQCPTPDEQIAALRAEVATVRSQLETVCAELTTRDAELATARSELADTRREVDRQRDQVRDRNGRIAIMRSEKRVADGIIAEQATAMRLKDEMLDEARGTIDELRRLLSAEQRDRQAAEELAGLWRRHAEQQAARAARAQESAAQARTETALATGVAAFAGLVAYDRGRRLRARRRQSTRLVRRGR